jgi:UDP:flavonoid glycosyltransferase YjiC (YdhE family)
MSADKPRILVTVLNWGLGHATRCIPLIRQLEQQGATVIAASDGVSLHLLRAEFPHLTVLELPSYRIRYETSNMVWNIARQLPRILYAVRAEHRMIRHWVRKYRAHGIISDNRYGCYHKNIKSVLITHQLHLRLPGKALQWAVNQLLHRILRRFDAIWVPDLPGTPNLSGVLSHPPPEHLQVHYIGPQSRMQTFKKDAEKEPTWQRHKTEYDAGVILSGPEPQRTILEQRLLEQAVMLDDYHFVFVQGKTGEGKEHYFLADHIEVVSYLTSNELNALLSVCKAVVCRSGYSSIMDLAALGLKAVLIPTPGQTEQEYLAEYFAEKNVFVRQRQEELDLEKALGALSGTTGLDPVCYQEEHLEKILHTWLFS